MFLVWTTWDQAHDSSTGLTALNDNFLLLRVVKPWFVHKLMIHGTVMQLK